MTDKEKKLIEPKPDLEGTTRVNFSIDSALLRELGERLVGRPHIALAELIKNSYDADAISCEIRLEPTHITITDNGTGMSEKTFKSRWMRIGTTKKQEEKFSNKFQRPLTGSKGVGRLSAQFLAERLTVTSHSEDKHDPAIYAYVNWGDAINEGELTKAYANFKLKKENKSYPNGVPHGTQITLLGLKQKWNEKEVTKLAQELWMLQSPEGLIDNEVVKVSEDSFVIKIKGAHEQVNDKFKAQMRAALQNWTAGISGVVVAGRKTNQALIQVKLKNGAVFKEKIPVPNCLLNDVNFQIRVFNLSGRQEHGISVVDARDYFKKHGGVHVYDSGFRLPYYGLEQDWLSIEADHARRITVSKLLPPSLHVDMAMNDLPTQQRIFGVVSVNTGLESLAAGKDPEHLKIQVTRDRLLDNEAYQQLKLIVRWSVDFYARCYRLDSEERKLLQAPEEPPARLLENYETSLRKVQQYVPLALYEDLDNELKHYQSSLKAEIASDHQEKALLAPLATAGMAALAFEHESGKEITEIKRISHEIDELSKEYKDIPKLAELSRRIKDWTNRVEGSRGLFSSLSNQEDREEVLRLKALPIINMVWNNLNVFMRGISLDTSEIPSNARLPLGTMADWQALFQNIFTNSANALLDEKDKIIKCVYHSSASMAYLDILDTGVGVDLETANELFLPFSRKLEISHERKALGLGGVGLGLTIVNMIAESRGFKVEFITPPQPFRTAVRISWKRPTA